MVEGVVAAGGVGGMPADRVVMVTWGAAVVLPARPSCVVVALAYWLWVLAEDRVVPHVVAAVGICVGLCEATVLPLAAVAAR